MSKAQGQFTIIDYNDALTLTGYIGSNLAKTQMYNPDNGSYTPDWKTKNLVLTPSLYVIGTTADQIATANVTSVKWYVGDSNTAITAGTNYGLSESTGPGCVHLGMENVHKVGAIGVPGYGWKAKIVDENDKPVEKGEVGELCVKGPGVMVEYYNDPEATAEVLKDGWLHTGDMARQDEDGFIFLVDRKKDVIISGGENLYPVQIEAFLAAHPKIHDVAVIGLPDKRLGEIAAAIIQVKEGETLTEEEVNKFCVDLPRYKRPRKIIFDEVIRNATGKIDKPKLREKYNSTRLVEEQNKG